MLMTPRVILVGWDNNGFDCIKTHIGTFFVSVMLLCRHTDFSFSLTSIYTPIDRDEKLVCWWEIKFIRTLFPDPWILSNDCNVTLSFAERSGWPGSSRDIR